MAQSRVAKDGDKGTDLGTFSTLHIERTAFIRAVARRHISPLIHILTMQLRMLTPNVNRSRENTNQLTNNDYSLGQQIFPNSGGQYFVFDCL